MKKKKLMSLIALGLALAYLAGALILFYATSSVLSVRFSQQAERIRLYNPMNSYAYHEMNIKEYSEIYMYQNSGNYPLFPYAAAIFDKDGNIVARSGSWLRCYDFEGENFHCYLEPYMTSEIKKTVAENQKETGYLFSHRFEYNIKNGEIVPVKLVVCDYNTENRFAPENLITLTFSDEKAQYSITDNEESGSNVNIYTTFVDTDENRYEHKLYTELYETIESEEMKEKMVRLCSQDNYGGGGSSSSAYFDYYDMIEVDGKKYCILQLSKRSEFLGTLLSHQFREFLIMELLVFIFIGFIIVLTANNIYNKNKKLENARVAFTGAAAHELKTPLAVISNQCECILEDIAPEKNKDYVESIYDEAKRMNNLIVTLLQYNRVSVLDKINKEKTDLASLARSETEKYTSIFEKKNIDVEIDTEKCEISCNTELLALVIDNFLSNAANHTLRNGRVKITVKKGVLTVYNSGSYITAEDAQHIWNEFYREDKARTSGKNSTGMGLAMSKKILQLHGYKYGFKNTDSGVEFYFSAVRHN
ncbi:MAG: HAMP domain-containing histidine kinase [Clostridia bacterium]|nr:HAMP domain-containing histidine kinase [Clostridia bacterium]